ncbi:hypothetical protein F5144DRAFT_588515 [Chaetomium tenue]|uniref:Uncharacterized protein n=1 Tax=Chaetomium tenue TaxID=1854479 RepID=A0ACB7PQK4_9PEZI|nr:hypothetical protein F5144DRAFT_588515 [Chaetomium globosum]
MYKCNPWLYRAVTSRFPCSLWRCDCWRQQHRRPLWACCGTVLATDSCTVTAAPCRPGRQYTADEPNAETASRRIGIL